MPGFPVVLAPSGGIPVTDTPGRPLATVATNGYGLPITVVGSGGWPLTLEGAAPVDSTPDAFAFTDIIGQENSTLVTSNTIVVAGLGSGVPAAITVTGGSYSKNGSAATSAPGTVLNGDTVAAVHTTSASDFTTVDTIVTIGGVSDTFSSRTLGPELFTNGGFTTDTTGWTPTANVSFASSSGEGLMTSTAASGAMNAQQFKTGLTIGQTYRFRVLFRRGTADNVYLTAFGAGGYGPTTPVTSTTNVIQDLMVTADATGIGFFLQMETFVIGRTAFFDNASLRRVS